MNKVEKIKALHKVLFIKENFDNQLCPIDDWYSYIAECLVKFCGINDKTKIDEKTILSLKGIRNLGHELTTKEIRSIILGLMNDYDREG